MRYALHQPARITRNEQRPCDPEYRHHAIQTTDTMRSQKQRATMPARSYLSIIAVPSPKRHIADHSSLAVCHQPERPRADPPAHQPDRRPDRETRDGTPNTSRRLLGERGRDLASTSDLPAPSGRRSSWGFTPAQPATRTWQHKRGRGSALCRVGVRNVLCARSARHSVLRVASQCRKASQSPGRQRRQSPSRGG